MSKRIDDIIGIVSPKIAFKRKAYRFAYDAIDKRRTRKKRTGMGGTGDTQLTETNLSALREIHLDMMRNNPLVKGLLKTERDGVVGPVITIQGRSKDTKYNEETESAWQEEMVDSPCDVTGRFNINALIRMSYLGYRRDGDAAIIFLDDKLQAIEGGQIGTPYGSEKPKNYEIINGVAVSNQEGRVIGYYIGKPNKWGYIKNDSFRKYPAELVQHIFSPERFSQSRGEPVLTASVNFIDTLCDYIDAELVAAKVNACFSMFVAQDKIDMPNLSTRGVSSSGLDEEENRLEKIEPGIIVYGQPGESATGIGQVRPGQLFDPFVSRMLTLIGRPLCMPLMLITLDFSGATFMNARIAYQKVQEAWLGEQENIIKPIISRIWRWFITRRFAGKDFAHEIICNRWPYVDPWKEAMADEQQLFNGTITRAEICSRQGRDFTDTTDQLDKEETYRAGKKVPVKQTGQRDIIKE
jgi:capsid protein